MIWYLACLRLRTLIPKIWPGEYSVGECFLIFTRRGLAGCWRGEGGVIKDFPSVFEMIVVEEFPEPEGWSVDGGRDIDGIIDDGDHFDGEDHAGGVFDDFAGKFFEADHLGPFFRSDAWT